MPQTLPFEALLWGPLLKRGYPSFSAKGDTVKIVSTNADLSAIIQETHQDWPFAEICGRK